MLVNKINVLNAILAVKTARVLKVLVAFLVSLIVDIRYYWMEDAYSSVLQMLFIVPILNSAWFVMKAVNNAQELAIINVFNAQLDIFYLKTWIKADASSAPQSVRFA